MLDFLAQEVEGSGVSKADLCARFAHATETIELLQRRELIEPTEVGYRVQVELVRRSFLSDSQGT